MNDPERGGLSRVRLTDLLGGALELYIVRRTNMLDGWHCLPYINSTAARRRSNQPESKMQATITSTNGKSTITGDLAKVLRAAITHDEDYQPAGGVTVECDDGRTFEVQDGRCPIWTDGEDGEDGEVMIAGDALVIAWDQGTRTPFADTALQPR